MEVIQPNSIATIKRTGFEEIDRIKFPDTDIEFIRLYSLSFIQKVVTAKKTKEKKRIYFIEIHYYNGFGMLKFYPRSKKNDTNKYKIRGVDMGFELNFGQVRQILKSCAYLMKLYLDDFPDNFMGYVGQTDNKDNLESNMREQSQRSYIYDTYTTSFFSLPKYNLSSKKLFGPINLKLIRRAEKHKEYSLSTNQKENYNRFLSYLEKNENLIPEFMTVKTRNKYYPELNN